MRYLASFALLFAVTAGAALAQAPATPPPPRLAFTNLPFEDGGIIPDAYVNRAGQKPGISPPLSWTNVPAGTQSLVLVVNDLDANNFRSMTGNVHWVLFNIPATTTSLPAGVPMVPQLPDGSIQPRRGNAPNYTHGYVGPAPPPPHHHYTFELYALDTRLPLDATATRDEVMAAAFGHVLSKAIFVGRWHR